MNKWKYVCPFLVFLILTGCASNTQVIARVNSHQEIGESVDIVKYEEDYNQHISYPKTSIIELDEKLEGIMEQFQAEFLENMKGYEQVEKAELNISYQSYEKDGRYISVKLEVFERIHDDKERVLTLCYDKDKQRFVKVEDLFRSDAMELIASKSKLYFQQAYPDECASKMFSIHIAPTADNYKNFVLRKDALVFYFQEGELFDKATSFELKYDDLKEVSDMEHEDVSVFVPYEEILNEPVKHIDPNKPMVALTFDDGPSKQYTIDILDALKENQASATFFVLGSRANLFPEILQRMVLEGNEIGNHTYSHKQLTTLSKERIEDEIAHAQESIHDVTNKYPRMIRPPYGSKNDMVLNCAQDKKIVTWSIDSEDWRSRNPETIVKRVLSDVKDGDIILLHDLYESTASATMILIPELQEMGFQLVTVSELYHYGKNTAGKIM